MANLEYDVPITPTTVFHVASVSKQFTAFAIARLIQAGNSHWRTISEVTCRKCTIAAQKSQVAPFAVSYERTERSMDAPGSGQKEQWRCREPSRDVMKLLDVNESFSLAIRAKTF